MTYFQISNRALLQNLVASALVLAGATACSRSDRTESGSSSGAATTQDTAMTSGSQTSTGTGRDSSTMNSRDTTISGGIQTGASTSDTVPAGVQSNKPRSKTGTTAAERGETMGREDTASAGYPATPRDTAPGHSDSARVTKDTSETSLNTDTSSVEMAGATQDTSADTSAAGYSEMARDTTTTADQMDTTQASADTGAALQAKVDTATAETQVAVSDSGAAIEAKVDTSSSNNGRVGAAVGAVAGAAAVGSRGSETTDNSGRVRPTENQAEVNGQVTTDNANAASDTTAGSAAVGARGADTTENAGRIRPPEDSTEMVGSVNAADSASAQAADTSSGGRAGAVVGAVAGAAAVGSRGSETTDNSGHVRPTENQAEVNGQVTTDNANATSDAAAANAAVGARGADTTENAGRIRPPEDSTEVAGNVNAADTADEAPVTDGRDNVGAASMGGTVTGEEAIAMMTRSGTRCRSVDFEADEAVRWDMSSTPSTLNPCGLGSMVLSKIESEQ
jgi:hypothetical protein